MKLKQPIHGVRLKSKICPWGPREKEKEHKVYKCLMKHSGTHSVPLRLTDEGYIKEKCGTNREQDL